MKILLAGSYDDEFLAAVNAAGLVLCERNPDVVVSVGGDGAFIGAERAWPGVPKLGIRRDDTCFKCEKHTDEILLGRLRMGALQESQMIKLEARAGGASLLALNDIIVRNADVRSAVRFRVLLDGHPITEELIGDGLVLATPFGSSAYFRSITGMTIRTGIGLAYNNCTDALHHLVVAEHETITVEIVRGPALFAADNDPELHTLEDGTLITVRRSEQSARVLAVDSLRCPECRYINAPRRRF